tara:strand:- start:70 stop:780 length:711 start_codon:yes stop_codon:yes gene_type:complete
MSINDNATNVKKVLITGASSGIGREVAKSLISRKYSVFLTGRNELSLNKIEGSSGILAGDLTSPAFVSNLVELSIESLGSIDVFVHCAGIGLIRKVKDMTDLDFVRVTNTNMRATFLIAQKIGEIMAKSGGGRFIYTPGILGKAPMSGASAYCASKFGAIGFLKSMELEYRSKGIQFTYFYFGGVDSPFWDELEMNVVRDKMIPVDYAASSIVNAIESPNHLVTGDVVIQPQTHQL